MPEELSSADCVVIATGHRNLDCSTVIDRVYLIVDTCYAIADARSHGEPRLHEKIVRLDGPIPG